MCKEDFTSTRARILLVTLVMGLVAGCSHAPVSRPYSLEELRMECVRTGGWWRSALSEGLCEYQADGKV